MYSANTDRYQEMIYNRLGASGLKISAVSLGLWHNFGSVDSLENQKKIIHQAFDLGITYYDLANNYGPVPGSAAENFGHVLSRDMKAYRDEMIISSKAGYHIWEGPYGDWGSRKSIIASANQSLQRMGLEYFDIFYSHRPDPKTPIEETALALDQLVREGKALYIGVSNYDGKQTSAISKIFHELKTPFVVNQSRYNMFNKKIEGDLLPVLKDNNKAAVVFSPLAQGLLTNRYLNGIPDDSRAAKSSSPFLKKEQVEKTLNTVKELECVAEKREQTLAEMAIAWNLRQKEVSSVIVGASRSEQLQNSVNALKNLTFSVEELKIIDKILDDVD